MPEQPLSDFEVYLARPTLRVDGAEQPGLEEVLRSAEMTESEGGMSSLELRVGNWDQSRAFPDFAWEDGRVLRLGADIALYGGDATSPVEIFRGAITGLEGVYELDAAPELVVLAEDALQRARMARRTAIHENVSLADLARALAQRLGLTPVISGFGDPLGTRVQVNESDLAFLRRLLADYDGDLQVVGSELHVSPRSEVRRGTLELEFGGQLLAARVLADLSHQVTQVTAAGWDPAQGRRVSASSTGASAGPGQGRTGAQSLRDTLGERSEHAREVAVLTDAEARALADAAFDRRARQFVTVEGTAKGNPALRVGTHVTLAGLGPRFSNTFYVVRACHRFDLEHGYKTDFTAQCAYLGSS